MKAAIYARVSAADGRQDTDNQLAQLQQFAAAQGWEVAAEYIDHEGRPAADRSQFRRLFADAAHRKFDLVLVWALDRFAPEGVAETFVYIDGLTSNGVQFVSFTEEDFRTTGPAGELMIALSRWISNQERVRISERVRAGLNRVRVNGSRSGKPVGRPRAVFRREDAIALRNSGLSWRQIASRLRVGMTTVRRACAGACNPCQNPQGEVL